MKKFYFLSGYSRSGNTLLSSILNQNKNITVSPNSCVVEIMYDLFKMYESSWIKNVPEFSGLNNVTIKLLENYYEHIDSKFIFERGAWGTPYNLSMLQRLNHQPKFLLLVRPLIEVLASYVKVQKPKDVENFIYNVMHPDVGKIYFDWQSTSNIIKTNGIGTVNHNIFEELFTPFLIAIKQNAHTNNSAKNTCPETPPFSKGLH